MSQLLVGAAETVITPPVGTALAGYFTPRLSTGVIHDLKAKAAAAQGYGIEIMDLGIRRLGVPDSVSMSVFDRMREDRNGVATTGLLFMERSWDTAYNWENAEAALAYFEAAQDVQTKNAQQSRQYLLDGLTILRAIAKHHYGPYGFLAEGVDWNNAVGQRHHIDQKRFGAVQYTEPFLNNQHIAEPTWF